MSEAFNEAEVIESRASVLECGGWRGMGLTPLWSDELKLRQRLARSKAVCALSRNRSYRRQVLECASPLALWKSWVAESARGLAHSKTLTRSFSAMGYRLRAISSET